MFLTLFRRELLANLMTFRFSVAMIICLLLVVANSIVLIGDYERRLSDYNTAEQGHRDQAVTSRTYSYLRLNVDRPPNPLSIFNSGMDRRLGNTVNVHHQFVPALWDASLHGADNPFLNLFSSIDLAFIFQIVLSLLALLFAYDAIAGEHENHTLRLMMTNPVSRVVILLAKYLSAMVCLILPLVISLMLALILFVASGSIAFTFADFLRIISILLTSVIFLSAFYLIGMLISTAARRTATALMLSIFVWTVFVLVYPSLSVATVNRLIGVTEKLEVAAGEMRQIWEEFDRVRTEIRRQDRIDWYTLEGALDDATGWHFHIGNGGHSSWGNFNEATLFGHEVWDSYDYQIDADKESLVPDLEATFEAIELARMRAAEKAWLVRQKALNETYGHKAKVAEMLIRLSPASTYDFATEALSGTDLREIRRFIESVQQYRQTLITYLHDKKAFSSRQWYSRAKEAVNWDDLPRFDYQRADFSTSLRDALPDVVLLLLTNVALFMVAFVIFVKQEV